MQPDTHGVRERMSVWSADGQKVGRVIAVAEGRFEVERGFFFPKHYVVPFHLVAKVENRGPVLTLTRQELHDEWMRLDVYGRAESGLLPPGERYVGADVPADLGEGDAPQDIAEDQDPTVVERYHHLLVRPDGTREFSRSEREGSGAAPVEPPPGRPPTYH